MHLSQLISDSDLLQLHRKEQTIPKYRGTATFTQKLLVSYSRTSQSPFIYTILKKIRNLAASLHLFFIKPEVQITVGLHWQSTTPQWGGKKRPSIPTCLPFFSPWEKLTPSHFNSFFLIVMEFAEKPFHGVRVPWEQKWDHSLTKN